jgi:type I restriction enzyme M protein
MITGDIKNQIDRIWDSFWSGGISNPLEVIEQITYLLFLRRLDDLRTLEANKANRLKKPMERRIFPEGIDAKGRPYDDYRWSRFKHFAPTEMFTVVGEHVFPFLRTDLARQLGNGDSTYAHHMKDARFTIPTPALLSRVVDLLDKVPMEDRDTKGDVYEYMLGKIASAGQNGQFRTPRHIIRLMVELTAPQPTDVICDPACGTAGFLVAAGEYLRERHPNLLHDAKLREHFHHGLFHGFDFDNTMLRIGSMNMLLHGVENPDIRYRDSLAQDHAGEEEKYTLVLANAPFAGSLDYENTAKDLLQIVKTKKDRAALPRALPTPAQARRPRRGDRARRRAVRLQHRAQGTAPHLGGGPEARRRSVAARRCLQALCGCLDRHPALHQDQLRRHRPGLVLRRRSRRLESGR